MSNLKAETSAGYPSTVQVCVVTPREVSARLPTWRAFGEQEAVSALSQDIRWLQVLQSGMRQLPYAVEALQDEQLVGLLPLMFVRSRLFGRFLISLPYLNTGGVRARQAAVANVLLEAAGELAASLNVRYVELRHEIEVAHPLLTAKNTSKAHLRLPLPTEADTLWKSLGPKVRNQIRKGEKQGFEVVWGGASQLADFYTVFSRNMRDLGTPVFSRNLFQAIVQTFPDEAEFCVVRFEGRPAAAALLLHGRGITEVPSASCLREFNPLNANMFMYWQLLQRSMVRRQATFDFGRSSEDSGPYRFKLQWGAQPHPAVWQYLVRSGSPGEVRPDNPKFQLAIRVWQRLPVAVANLLGPPIVRGIP